MPGKPIKVIWSREDDVTQDMWRPMRRPAHRGRSRRQGRDRRLAPSHRRGSPIMARGIPPLFKKLGGKDSTSAGGGEFRYAVPAQHVDYVRAQSGFEVGAWRGISAGYTKFAVETHGRRGRRGQRRRSARSADRHAAKASALDRGAQAVAADGELEAETAGGPRARARLFRRAAKPIPRRWSKSRSMRRAGRSTSTTSGRRSIPASWCSQRT